MTNTYILSLSMLFKHISAETKKAAHRDGAKKWCLGTESNRRHGDFQSPALPTELPRHVTEQIYNRFNRLCPEPFFIFFRHSPQRRSRRLRAPRPFQPHKRPSASGSNLCPHIFSNKTVCSASRLLCRIRDISTPKRAYPQRCLFLHSSFIPSVRTIKDVSNAIFVPKRSDNAAEKRRTCDKTSVGA